MSQSRIEGQAALIKALPEPSLLVAGDGLIYAANPPLLRVLGLPSAVIVAQPLKNLVSNTPEKLKLFLKNCARSRQPVPGTLTFALPNKSLTYRCEGMVVEPQSATAPALVLLRLRSKDSAASRFLLLNRTIEELNREVSERRQAEARLRVLAEVSTTLAALLEYRTIFQQLVEQLVGHYADWCLVYLAEPGIGIQRIATAHVNPAKQDLANQLSEQSTHYAIPAPFMRVVETGQSLFSPHYDEATILQGITDTQQIAIIRQLDPKSVIVVPLQTHEQTLGALALVWSDSERRYSEADLVFAEEVARRVALVAENARLYQEAHATELQLRELNATLEQKVQLRTEQVRHLVTQLTMSEQEERRRISGILHDDLQQRLYSLCFQLVMLNDMLENGHRENARRLINDLEEALLESIQITRSLSVDLSPPVLHNEGLPEALRWLANQMKQQQGLAVRVENHDILPPLHEDLRVLLFRTVRELLFNTAKHAGVATASIRLAYKDGQLQIEVSDQGRGFDLKSQKTQTSQGLFRIGQRLELIGGRMQIDSAQDKGTRTTLSIPLHKKDDKAAGTASSDS